MTRISLCLLFVLSMCPALTQTPEIEENGSLETAVPLTLEDRFPSGELPGAFGTGAIEAAGDIDYWRFEALAGDRVSIAVDAHWGALRPQIELRNAANGYLSGDSDGGPGSSAYVSHYVIPGSGAYYVRISGRYSTFGDYKIRVLAARGIDLESDREFVNNTISGSDPLTWSVNVSLLSARTAGSIMNGNSAGGDVDRYQLGYLNADSEVSLTIDTAGDSGLQPILKIFNQDGVVFDGTTSLTAIIPSDGLWYAEVSGSWLARPGSRYLLLDYSLWDDAATAAETLGGQLWTVNNEAENLWAREYFVCHNQKSFHPARKHFQKWS